MWDGALTQLFLRAVGHIISAPSGPPMKKEKLALGSGLLSAIGHLSAIWPLGFGQRGAGENGTSAQALF